MNPYLKFSTPLEGRRLQLFPGAECSFFPMAAMSRDDGDVGDFPDPSCVVIRYPI